MADRDATFDMDDLLYLMQRLRHPEAGCPWDLKQNYRSIAPSTIEEAYEVVDAIEREDFVHLKEELGDLLFQTIFYSQLAREEGRFMFTDVVDTLVVKLIRRHPHVFPDGVLRAVDNPMKLAESQVKHNWETIKQQEREAKGDSGLLADVPVALPATIRAAKLQKRAAQIGFDWPDASGVLEKLQEEMRELSNSIDRDDQTAVEAEMGDLLFTCINLARHLKIDPDTALRAANKKFTGRFVHMEMLARIAGKDLSALSQPELERRWEVAKEREGAKEQKISDR